MKTHQNNRVRVYAADRKCSFARTLIVLSLALTGCSAVKVSTEHDTDAKFSTYKTFAVLPLSTTGAGVDPGAALRLARPAEQAVRDALTAKGFTEAPRESADFAVLARGESLPRTDLASWGYVTYPTGMRHRGWVGGYREVKVNQTEDRKLIVEVFDNASHKQAWVGWIKHSDATGPVDPEKLRANIGRILEQFPPPPKLPNQN